MALDNSNNLQLVEHRPKDSNVSLYIEKYQFYQFDTASWIKSLPNTRLECWQIFKGGFNIWNQDNNEFMPAPIYGGYPATNQSLLLNIPDRLYCINLKVHLRSLCIPFFQKLYPPDPFADRSDIKNLGIFPEEFEWDVFSPDIDTLDKQFSLLIGNVEPDQMIDNILDALQKSTIPTVGQLSKEIDCSLRNLQRITRKKFNLSPKELLSIFRFNQTTHHFKQESRSSFINALAFGYYDQSHFIRECNRIAGVSPKELFNNLSLPTHDLMVYV